MTAAPKTLASAMASAFAEFEAASKAANNPHFKSKYADLPAVIEAVKPALIAHRLFFTQATHEMDGGVCVETLVHHECGESMSFGRLFVPASKSDAHGYGSALTYARRYSLMTAFGIPAEDDDGNAAARTAPAARTQNGHANGNAKIDEHQFAQLQLLIEQSGTNTQAFCEHFRTPSVKDLPASKFEDASAALRKKLTTKEPA